MSASFWATLGIEPTRERGEIRRAYAAKLKITNPEDDPTGFQALRAAYERALAYAHPPKPTLGETAPRVDEIEEIVRRPRRQRVKTPDVVDGDDAPDEQDEPDRPDEGKPSRRHDWRPADKKFADKKSTDEEPELSDERRRQWRPPDPQPKIVRLRQRTHRAPDIVVDPDAEQERAYGEARNRLTRAIGADDRAEQIAALKALFALPAMDSVDRYARAESWLAGLIVTSAPRADILIDMTIGYFRWDESRVGPRSLVGARVLSRREDLRLLAALLRSGNRQHGAYLALTRPASIRRRLANWMTPGMDGEVRSLLAMLRATRPGLVAGLNPVAVAWWERRLERPHIGPLSIWTLILAPPVFAILAAGGRSAVADGPGPWTVYLAALAIAGAGVAFNLFGVTRPRLIWRRRWAARAPPWVRLGWAPTLCLVLIASALIPPSWPAVLALDGVAALALYWAAIVGDPDRRPGERMPWQVRSIFSFTYLAAFWMMSRLTMPLPIYNQISLPLTIAGLGFVLGEGTLIGAWHRDLSERGRRRALGGLAAWVAVTVVIIFLARDDRFVLPLASALVAIAVLVHKAPASTLSAYRTRLRHYAMAYGWLGWLMFTAIVSPHHAPVLMIGGFWLLTGVTITASMALDGARWWGLVGGRAARKA